MRGSAHLVALNFRLLLDYHLMIWEVNKVFDQTLAVGAHNVLWIKVYLLILFFFDVLLELIMILSHKLHLD